MAPRTGPPGTLITMTGRLFTDRVTSDVARGSNGREEMITRLATVYLLIVLGHLAVLLKELPKPETCFSGKSLARLPGHIVNFHCAIKS